MSDRLKQMRKSLELSQEAFGQILGVTKTAISSLESGRRNLTEQMIKSICREFNVNEQWFRNGTGEMFLEASGILLADQIRRYNLDALDTLIVEEYMKLAPEHRKIMKNYLLALTRSMPTEAVQEVIEAPYPYEKDFDSMTREEKLAAFVRELDEQEKGQISQESTDVFSDTTSKMA